LLLKARASKDVHELRRANAIWIIYLTYYLGLITRIIDPIDSYYGQTDRLAELIELTKKLLEGHDDTGFSLEMTFLIPLHMLAYMFRHRGLRQEAI
jgi:hypothetical protein